MISAATSFYAPRGGAAAPAASPDGDNATTSFEALTAQGPTDTSATAPKAPATPAAGASSAAFASPSTLVAISAPVPVGQNSPIALPTVETGEIPADGDSGTGVTATLPAAAGGKPRVKDGFSLPAILVVGSDPAPPSSRQPVAPIADPRLPLPSVPAGKAPRTADVPANDDTDPPVDGAPAPLIAPVVVQPVIVAIVQAAGKGRDDPEDKPETTDKVATPTVIVALAPPPPTPATIAAPVSTTASTPITPAAIDGTREPDRAPIAADAPTKDAAAVPAKADAPAPISTPPLAVTAPSSPAAPPPVAPIQTSAPTPPAPSASRPPVDAGTVTAQAGRIGQEMGVVIARHAATGGGEAITVRLDPADMGRIEVRLSFSEGGTLRAVVAAENPASLDLLRRDSADLNRALADAGVRADQQTLRFDDRPGSGGDSGGGNRAWQRWADPRTAASGQDYADTAGPDPIYRPLTTSGRIDLMA